MNIAPSILSFDLTRLGEGIRDVADLQPSVIHLDVMDGQFVPPITFGDAYVKSLRRCCEILFEVHLMTLTPERHFESFVAAGCGRVIFHLEATSHAHRLVQQIRGLGAEAAVAINPGTAVEEALAIASEVSQILVMTVNPGWGGQRFLEFTLEKVRRIRQAFPDITIEVDGGIDPDTIIRAADAGADLFVVGSYLAKAADLKAAYSALAERR